MTKRNEITNNTNNSSVNCTPAERETLTIHNGNISNSIILQNSSISINDINTLLRIQESFFDIIRRQEQQIEELMGIIKRFIN